MPVNLLSKKATSSNRQNLKKFGKAISFMFLSVLILKDVLHIILLYGVHILTFYNPKLTFEERNFLVLYVYITNLMVHGQQKSKVDVLSYISEFLKVCRVDRFSCEFRGKKKFHENPFSRSEVVTYRQTDRHGEEPS
jgi:hypothetical protein